MLEELQHHFLYVEPLMNLLASMTLAEFEAMTASQTAKFLQTVSALLQESGISFMEMPAKMLWHSAYWDGPISGMCEVKGKSYWFHQMVETSGVRCPKDEECTQRIEAELDANVLNDDTTDEEWGCPPGLEGCWVEFPQRYYGIYEISDENVQILTERHQLFRDLVGHHTDYDAQQKRTLGTHGDQEKSADYYKIAATWPKLSLTEKLVGYFAL